MMPSIVELADRLIPSQGLARLGQALWMRIGQPIQRSELIWAKSLLGEGGDALLWDVLLDEQIVVAPDYLLDACSLARVLCALARKDTKHKASPSIVWTLPKQLLQGELENSYTKAAVTLIEGARQSIIVVSPYLEAKGIGKLFEPLLNALSRKVYITVITHGAAELSSQSSTALEELRREANGLPGQLAVFSAVEDAQVLLHSKLIIADREQTILGSANLTGSGLASNFEAGVVLGLAETTDVVHVVDMLLASKLVLLTYSTDSADNPT